jgi:protease secretion system outer membrane protein
MRANVLSLLFLWPCLMQPASALGLLDIYALAQQKDPAFQAARQEHLAGQENENIARSGLLPSVSLSYQNGVKNWQTSEILQSKSLLSKETQKVTHHRQYQSQSGSLMLTQPLFDYEAWSRYQAGKAQSRLSEASWNAKSMELAVRVVNRYLDVMIAQDEVALLSEQQATWRQQLRQNQRMIQSGEGTVTETVETEARLALSAAELIVAQGNLEKARHELESMIGQPIASLSLLDKLAAERFAPIALRPATFAQWRAIALKNNAELAAARQQTDIQHYQTEQQRAGYFPRIQLYASQGLNNSSSDTTVDQRYKTTSIGIQLNYSLYAGGYSSASVRQTRALYNKSKFDLERVTNDALNNLNVFFNQCHNAERRIKAYTQAVRAAELQIKAVEHGISAGQRKNIDLLNSRQQLYSTRLELTKEKYEYIRAWLMLLYHSGQLKPEKIIEIANYFKQ